MSTEAVGRTRAALAAEATSGASAEAPELLAEPSGDPATMVMQLMVKLHQQQKAADRREEDADEKRMVAENDQKVQSMHDKAADIFAEGMVSAGLSIAQGMATIGAASASYEGKMKDIDARDQNAEADFLQKTDGPDPSKAQCERVLNFRKGADALSRQGAGMELSGAWRNAESHAFAAGREGASAGFKMAETNDDANAAQHDGAARLEERHANEARDRRKASEDDIRFVLDWFKKMQDTTNETTHTLAQRV